MDNRAQADRGALAFEPGYQVGGQLGMLRGGAQDELAGVRDEGLRVGDLDRFGRAGGGIWDVTDRVPGVGESQEGTVQIPVYTGWKSTGHKSQMTRRLEAKAAPMERSLITMVRLQQACCSFLSMPR